VQGRAVRRLQATAAVVFAVAAAWPASAAEPGPPNGSFGNWPPADSGKPQLVMPPPAPLPEPARCPPALPCGTELYGVVEKNGAVELKVPVLRW
jgi:hypothetical protein